MTRSYVSGSRLPLVSKCSASGALPIVYRVGDKDRMGNALHEHACDRSALGIDGACERLPQIAQAYEFDETVTRIFTAMAKGCDFQPPKGAIPEIALALFEDGHVERVQGGRGRYDNLPPGAILPMTIDLLWAEPEPLYIGHDGIPRCPPGSVLCACDIKTGKEAWVDAIDRNKQLLAAVVLGAIWTQASCAMPMIYYWRHGPGLWEFPEQPMNRAALLAGEKELRAYLVDVEGQRQAMREGAPLSYTTGPWCRFCDSATYCAAQTAIVKRFVGSPHMLSLAPEQLTEAQRYELAVAEPLLEQLHKATRRALIASVDALGPIDQGGGKYWGAYTREGKSEIDPKIARQMLADEIGERDAQHAFDFTTTRAAIERAIKTAHRKTGIVRMFSRAMARVMARVQEAGGLQRTTQIAYGTYASDSLEAAPPSLGAGKLPALLPAHAAIPIDRSDDE